MAQAAAWHLANNKSWQELASLEFRRLAGLPPVPQFSSLELNYAQTAVASAKVLADAKAEQRSKAGEKPAEPVRRDRTGRVISQR